MVSNEYFKLTMNFLYLMFFSPLGFTLDSWKIHVIFIGVSRWSSLSIYGSENIKPQISEFFSVPVLKQRSKNQMQFITFEFSPPEISLILMIKSCYMFHGVDLLSSQEKNVLYNHKVALLLFENEIQFLILS